MLSAKFVKIVKLINNEYYLKKFYFNHFYYFNLSNYSIFIER